MSALGEPWHPQNVSQAVVHVTLIRWSPPRRGHMGHKAQGNRRCQWWGVLSWHLCVFATNHQPATGEPGIFVSQCEVFLFLPCVTAAPSHSLIHLANFAISHLDFLISTTPSIINNHHQRRPSSSLQKSHITDHLLGLSKTFTVYCPHHSTTTTISFCILLAAPLHLVLHC